MAQSRDSEKKRSGSTRGSGQKKRPASGTQQKPTPSHIPIPKSKRFLGGFELLEKVGAGAMGAVFRARQTSLDRIVALKVLPARIAKDQIFIKRFVREARASGNLNHPNIVQGIDVGKDDDAGLWYFAMEFVDGMSVKQLLHKKGRLPEKRALEITMQMAQALKCAERAKIVHRDIKPDNIMLTKRGDAKLADLGLAKCSNEDAAVTQSGMAVGTPHYISPEQAQGVKNIDVRSDIYSLGATLFHMVTGTTPFQGDTAPVIMVCHIKDPPPLAHETTSGISQACGLLIDDMLQKEPDDRIRSAEQLISRINKITSHKAGVPKKAPSPKTPRAMRASKGNRSIATAEGKEPTTGRLRPIRGDTTGPRGAIRGKASRSPSNANSSPIPLIIGGAIIALIIPILMMSGSSKPQKRTNQASRQTTPKKTPRPRRSPKETHNENATNKGTSVNEIPARPAIAENINTQESSVLATNEESASIRKIMDDLRKKAQAEAERKRAIEESRKRYAEFQNKFDSLALSGKFTLAQNHVNAAQSNNAFKDSVSFPSLLELGRNFSRIAESKKTATEVLLKPEHIRRYKIKKLVKVLAVSSKEIEIQTKYSINKSTTFKPITLPYSSLTPETKEFIHNTLRGDFEPVNSTDYLTLGILAMSIQSHPLPEKNMAWAKSMIEKSGDHPLKAHYMAIHKIREQRLLRALAAAKGPPHVLFITSSDPTNSSDQIILRRMEHLGCIVDKRNDDIAAKSDMQNKALVVISSSISMTKFKEKTRLLDLAKSTTPILTWEPKLYPLLGMTRSSGWLKSGSKAMCRKNKMFQHINGPVKLLQIPDAMAWGTPAQKADIILASLEDPSKAHAFSYDQGDPMILGAAPAKRIGLHLSDYSATSWSTPSARIFDAAIRWSIPRLQEKTFLAVPKLKRSALLVVGIPKNKNREGDYAVRDRLRELNFNVKTIRDTLVDSGDAEGKHLVLISSTCKGKVLAGKLKDVTSPVIIWEPSGFVQMGMTASPDHSGWIKRDLNRIRIRSTHHLAASLTGTPVICEGHQFMPYAKPSQRAIKIASIAGEDNKWAIFAYEKGTQMAKQAAPARRVGFFFSDFSAADSTENGWSLFDAAVKWCTD